MENQQITDQQLIADMEHKYNEVQSLLGRKNKLQALMLSLYNPPAGRAETVRVRFFC